MSSYDIGVVTQFNIAQAIFRDSLLAGQVSGASGAPSKMCVLMEHNNLPTGVSRPLLVDQLLQSGQLLAVTVQLECLNRRDELILLSNFS